MSSRSSWRNGSSSGRARLGAARLGAARHGKARSPIESVMIQKNPECTIAVDALAEFLLRHSRGQTVAWEQIDATIDCSHESARGRHVVNRARARLQRDHNLVTRSEIRVGIELLTHKEAARWVPIHRHRRAARQLHRGIREMRAVDTVRLSDHERRLHAMQLHRMLEERRECRKSARDHEANKPAESLPRPVVSQQGSARQC